MSWSPGCRIGIRNGKCTDELSGSPGTPPSGAEREGFGLQKKLVFFERDIVFSRQTSDNLLIQIFFRLGKSNGKTESSRKTHTFLQRVIPVDIISASCGKGFPNQMTAVA